MGKSKWGIGGNEIHSDDIFMIKKIKMSYLIKEYKLGNIIIPQFQREVDQGKILKIYKNQKKYKKKMQNWILQQGVLTICVLEISETNYKLYLIDGQHRLLAMELLEKKDIITDDEVLIQMKKCNSIKEMKIYFKTLNINSKIEIQYQCLENEFYEALINNFKSKLKSLFPNGFSRTKNITKTNQFHHIDQFIELFSLKKLKNTEYVDGINLDVDLLLEKLIKINLEIKDKYDELKKNDDIDNYLYKSTLTKLKKSGLYLSLKNVNFIDYLIGNKEEIIIKPQKKKKRSIPKKIRIKLWESKFDDSAKGNCYCCNDNIDKTEFHAGHIISEYEGGDISLENLEPICKSCNSSMGIMNMYEFKNKYYDKIEKRLATKIGYVKP